MKLLHKNSLSGVGQLVLTAGLTFFSIPMFIRALGDEAYGAFSIVTLAGNLNIFANLGLNTGLMKSLSVQGKSQESDYDIAVTLGLLLLIMLPLSALAISQQTVILQDWLGLPDGLYSRIALMYRYVVAANLIILVGQTFTTILDSQQRIYLTNFYQLVYSILYWGGIIVVVSAGYDLAEVGLVILGAAVIWFVLVAIATGRLWGRLALRGLGAEAPRIARKQITFSSRIYAAGLLNMLFEPLTKLLVARFIGVREVGYLEIAYKVRAQLWSLVTKATYPIYPTIARETNPLQISRFISNYQVAMLVLIIPFLVFLSAALPDLINLWLPAANVAIVTATLCISATYLIGTLAVPPYYFLMSHHHVGKIVWLQLSNVLVNSIVILATYQVMGFYGVVLANSLAILSSLLLSMYFQKKYLGFATIDGRVKQRLWTVIPVIGLLTYWAMHALTEPLLRIIVASLCALLGYLLLLRGARNQFKSWTA